MKILTVVGARPQFIKAAAVSREIRPAFDEILVHTGQHYDKNMSDIFFDELDIPKPDFNLQVGSASHAKQTADMLIGLENIMLSEKPDFVMVYGDTNSTLAGALAAVKLHIPILHIEAGLRSFNNLMPEEINRILTDRISDYLFCPTDTAVKNLSYEGTTKNVFNVGDVMCDAVLYYKNKISADGDKIKAGIKSIDGESIPAEWYLTTIHRAENTDSSEKIAKLLTAFEKLDKRVVFPVHPRVKKLVDEAFSRYDFKNVLLIEPVGYVEMLYLTQNAAKVVTDSGGLQKEAYILGTPCVTVREQTEWVETLRGNYNVLARIDECDIVEKINDTRIDPAQYGYPFGDGCAARKIKNILAEIEEGKL